MLSAKHISIFIQIFLLYWLTRGKYIYAQIFLLFKTHLLRDIAHSSNNVSIICTYFLNMKRSKQQFHLYTYTTGSNYKRVSFNNNRVTKYLLVSDTRHHLIFFGQQCLPLRERNLMMRVVIYMSKCKALYTIENEM